MKKYFLLSCLTFSVQVLFGQNTLFISEYLEGSSNNKALEIFNSTTDSLDLTVQNIVLQVYANGATSPTNTIPLTGILASGKTFVITHSSFALAVPSGTIQQTSSLISFNGDDAVVLRSGGATGTILDVIGQIGFRPTNPSAWAIGTISTLDHTLIRNASINHGDVIGSDVFDVSLEWTSKPIDDFSDLGKHSTAVVIYSIIPENLSFTSDSLTHSSVSKKVTIEHKDSISEVQITAPINFEISTDSLTGFSSALNLTTGYPANVNIPIYVRYKPISGLVHSGKVSNTIKPANIVLELPLSGQVVGNTVIPISAIQSNTKSTPFAGNKVIVQGVVTKDLQKATEQKGFFIQDISPDASDLTSEGIFVFDSLGSTDVIVGNLVIVSGTAAELFGQTVIKQITSVNIINVKHALPSSAIINFPLDSVGELEKFEGMLVKFPQSLAVTEVYNLGRYGEVTLSLKSPLITPTNFIDPNDNPATGNTDFGTSNITAINNQTDLNNRSRILLSDDVSTQNPNPIPFIDPINKTLRVGSTIDTLSGILSFDFGFYLIYTVNNPKINYDPRPAVPNVGAANVKVAAMNVLNFFNGDGSGGGFPTPRGATTAFELRRQKIKIVAAIKGLDADILGMMEMENDGDGVKSALQELVDSVNITQSAGNKYAFVLETGAGGNPGTDAIKVAIMYKISKVTPFGVAQFNNSASFTSLGRPPLAQTFSLNSNGEKLTVIVNHFKSKGCGSGASAASGADADMMDGQSCFNDIRKKQAAELITFINTLIAATNDSDVVIMGDFNAYNEEDPLDRFRKAGLKTLLENSYSFVFDALLGALDHAFATPSLTKQLTGIDKWHINSVEPRIIDYTTAFKTQDLFVANAYRASDHDPLLIGFHLTKSIPTALENEMLAENESVFPNPVKKGSVIYFSSSNPANLYNSHGNEVAKSSTGVINTEGIPTGIYTLIVKGRKPFKIIVAD